MCATPTTPLTQPERVRALHSYAILDTPREADFDEIVDFVAQLCDVPIAVVNLLDNERQWFKAEVGLGVDQTPLDTSMCFHTLMKGAFLEIQDTQADARTRNNALCNGDDAIRFYAGAVLQDDKGMILGTLCALDRRPRQLTAVQRNGLSLLADQVVRQMQLRRALRDQEFLQKEMDHRVRNSLMTVAALLRVERQSVSSDEARASLAAAERRIKAVAQVHQELYTNASTFDQVELAPFIGRLSDQLREVLPPNVELHADVEPIWLKVQAASALAMIFSEFVANSAKHAFPDGKPGRIEVIGRMGATADGSGREYTMSVRDDGVGMMPAAPRAETSAQGGIGLKIIAAAASQLDGSYEIVDRADRKAGGEERSGTILTVSMPVAGGSVGANAGAEGASDAERLHDTALSQVTPLRPGGRQPDAGAAQTRSQTQSQSRTQSQLHSQP